MSAKEVEEKNQEEMIEDDLNETGSVDEIRKVGTDLSEDMDSPRFYQKEKITNYQLDSKKSGKKTLLLGFILALILLGILGVVFRDKVNAFLNGVQQTVQPTPTPSATLEPTPTPNPLIRSDWSLEVLNGSGVSGQAKKLADKLRELGYAVVKTGNADKDTYEISEILVKSDLQDKLDTVIVDLKDTIKIASIGGELKDSTASAQIIIGKDYNP